MGKNRVLKVSFVFVIVVIILFAFILINWKPLFGENRPVQNLKAIYQIEIQDKQIAQTSNVHNVIQYIVPKGKLDAFIDAMGKKGYKLIETDPSHNRLEFQKDNNIISISYKTFAKKYIKIENPFEDPFEEPLIK
ncbi:MAG: hypothetical protein H9W81_15170 [Enterococcus sp.]|nr:hypothetical protein [Enterococcus sp.]